MPIPITVNHEIQKFLKERNLFSGEIDGIVDDDVLEGIEQLFFQMGINYAGWKNDRKIIAAEELLYESQGIDVGKVDGLDDHYIQHARQVYNAKLLTTWRDKAEEIHIENAPVVGNCSEWAKKYTLTQKVLGISGSQYDAYREAVGHIESRNNPDQGAGGAGGHYYGMYQFGTAATETTSAFLKDDISKEEFEGNQDLAEKHFDALSYLNHKTLSKNDEYNALSKEKKLAVLGYAHNQGAGGARKWLQTGKEGMDAFGTSGKKYYTAILKALKDVNEEEPAEPEVKPKLVQSTGKKLFIGDSVAIGLFMANSEDGAYLDEKYAKVGASPKAILDKIRFIPESELTGTTVILSAGLLNNVTDTASVDLSIQVLKAKGAEVRLVGGPITSREPFSGVNDKLKEIAEKNDVVFLGSFESNDGVHPKSYVLYPIESTQSFKKQETKVSTEVVETKKVMSLRDIDLNQLRFIRGIGQTETHYSKKEAYSEQYNQESNNRNVREYGEKGADYGYYQCNQLDVEHAIRIGVNPEIAKHLNGGGKGGTSSIAQQTMAMHEYIKRVYKEEYDTLKSGDDEAFEAAVERMNGKWFGLKDRPEEARKIWNSKVTVEFLFPEVAFSTPPPPKKIVEEKKKPVIVNVPKKKYNWPKQSSCEDFYGEVGTSQVKCQLPFKMALAWDTGTTLSSYSCHKLVKEPMERIWNRVYEHYGYEKIVELRLNLFGGCLNVRKMRGGSSWSMHAWGIAVDIDPVRNALNMNKNEATLSKSVYDKYWEFIYDEGAIGLGPERDFDWMHWQFSKL